LAGTSQTLLLVPAHQFEVGRDGVTGCRIHANGFASKDQSHIGETNVQVVKSAIERRLRERTLLAFTFIAIPGVNARAQSTAPTVLNELRQSLSTAARASDSLTLESQLEALVRTEPQNASAWNLLGTLRWRRAAALRRGGYIGDKKTINTLMGADSALRLATQFAPDSARYWLSLARYGLESGVASVRFATGGQLERALSAATRLNDSMAIAEGADELGLATWRRYEMIANRALVSNGQHVQLQSAMMFKRTYAKDYVATFARKVKPPTGDGDFATASSYFRQASEAAPVSLSYARHVYMTLCTAGEWESLLGLATARAKHFPFDAQARLAQTLALHRLGREREARAALDSASALMDDVERENLFRVDRLLAPTANPVSGKHGYDSTANAATGLAQQQTINALYWQLNDPISATPENEALLEFVSRVVEAEFRWTDEIQKIAGADSDRGDIFIRYGPPSDVMTIPGTPSVQVFADTLSLAAPVMSSSQLGGTTLVWTYASGDVFFFDMAPGFGTARTPLTDQNFVRDYKSLKPVNWENIGAPRRVASMPVSITRFRGVGDSTDIVVALSVPTRKLIADSVSTVSSSAYGGAILVDTRIVDGTARTVLRDTSVIRTSAASVTRDMSRVITARIGTGAAFIRGVAEHIAPNSEQRRMANALVAVTGERTTGFGVSDVLLTTPGTSSSQAEPERWNNSNSAPSAGVYAVGDKIGLLWEIYALADSSNSSRYRVTVTVERTKRTGVSGFALRVFDGVGALLRSGNSGGDQLAIAFDRTHPTRSVVVEQITLDGLATSSGLYRVRVDVRDLLTNRSVSRERQVIVQ
jgi:GWxTD domain-containing protein